MSVRKSPPPPGQGMAPGQTARVEDEADEHTTVMTVASSGQDSERMSCAEHQADERFRSTDCFVGRCSWCESSLTLCSHRWHRMSSRGGVD